MGSCSQPGKEPARKSWLFKDCGCGCGGTKQEKKFITSIISGLTFFVVANPNTYRAMRKLLGTRIASPNGNPTMLGLVVHSVVFLLIVWGMMNIPEKEGFEEPPVAEETETPVVEEEVEVDEEEVAVDEGEQVEPSANPTMVVPDEDEEAEEDEGVESPLPPLEDAQPVIPLGSVMDPQYRLFYDPSDIKFDLQFENEGMIDEQAEGDVFTPIQPTPIANPIRLPEVNMGPSYYAAYDFDAAEIDPVKASNEMPTLRKEEVETEAEAVAEPQVN